LEERIVYLFGGVKWLGTTVVILSVLGCVDEKAAKQASKEIKKTNPSGQIEFCRVIADYGVAYLNEVNGPDHLDKKQNIQDLYEARTETIKRALGSGAVVKWRGTLDEIYAIENKGALLEVKLPCESSLSNNDSLIIPLESELYQALREYHEGSTIIFSGHFILPPENKDGEYPYKIFYAEQSFTQSGSMEKPEFYFQFTDFHKEH
jgi:hypothetical protein